MASPGSRVGPYELLASIGVGGMGEVWKARDTRLNREVAIKFAAARFSERFEREARAVAALNHPHICTLYDVGPDFLVMELVEGQPLTGPMPLDRARTYAGQILSALDAAHRKGITHRDLKPANILVSRQGIKLLDFGLAMQRPDSGVVVVPDQERTGAMTGAHTILGTVPYMSPEQAQGKAVDSRSDIFSFGLVLYEMITGARAFDGPDPTSVMAAIIERPAPSVGGLAPSSFDRVLQKCLAKDPDERWQSARDLRTALDWSGETAPPQAPSRVLRWRWAASVVAALAIGSALGSFWALVRAPAAPARALSLEIRPPAGAEFDLSVLGGGSTISRDGTHVAFVARTDGIPKLWVRSLDSVTSRALPDTEGALLPFWSPDGRSLGYFANGYLRRIEVSGGASTALSPVSSPRGGTWSADDTIIVAESVGPMRRIAAAGGTPSPLTTVANNETSHRWPRILPDGRTLFFFVQGEQPGIYVTTLDRPEVKRHLVGSPHDAGYIPSLGGEPGQIVRVQGDALAVQPFDLTSMQFTGPSVSIPGAGNAATNSGANRSHLSVADDGTILYTAGTSRYQLTWFSEDGAALGTVGPPDRYVGLRLSPDGSEALVFVDDATGTRDIWRIELARNVRSRVTSGNQGHYAIWSPDGRHIAFSGLTRQTLLERAIDETSAARRLHRAESSLFPSDWSGDGRFVLFTLSTLTGQYDVWTAQSNGSGNATPLFASAAAESQAQLSPDGRMIAFTSNESGRDEVYVQAFPGGGARRLASTGGGSYPRWGQKGAVLYYRSIAGRVVTVTVRFDGSAISLGAPRIGIRLLEPPASMLHPYDVAPDGRILALAPVSGESADPSLTVLVNWRAALRR